MTVPDWLRDLSVLLSPLFALAGVGLASGLSAKRESESHQRQLERDQEAHRQARAMWQLEHRRTVYTDFLDKCERMVVNLGSKSFAALETLRWYELLLVASEPVNEAFKKFNAALTADLEALNAGEESGGKAWAALAVLAGAMAADMQMAAQGVDISAVPASASADLDASRRRA